MTSRVEFMGMAISLPLSLRVIFLGDGASELDAHLMLLFSLL